MTDRPRFFRPIQHRIVARALRPALVWAYVAVFVAALLVILVWLLAIGVGAGVWVFNRDHLIMESAAQVVRYALWVSGPVTVGVAVAGAAYGSTESRSFPRTVTGTIIGVGFGAALLGVGASGFAAAGLAAGWGSAIPADRTSRIAARGLPMLVAAIAATVWPIGRIVDLGRGPLVAVFALSPLLAALVVWAGDAAWAAISGGKEEPKSTPVG